ncbi:uncharacterized protein LOC127715402 [Mytilus californianus]|uniref:uncharacterized protein LOC127715402 n=1 Tax=Mytilus californianus TaxID=6549 RepID=UPI0022483C9C|nr:uncharacterized protein LOC127715402 [Mytilus californianus]
MRCVRRLIYCVEHSICPHYFIPESNLFENKIKGKAQGTLLKKLNTLNSYGWRCILFSDQISYFNELAFHILNEESPLCFDSLKLIVSPFMFLTNFVIPSYHSSWRTEVPMILSLESSKIKYLYAFYMSKKSCFKAQLLPFDSLYDNKSTYKQHKTCINTLLLNIRHDAVSGWLMVASFFYKTKQYKIAYCILQYSLLKCSPEKLYIDINLSEIHYEILSLDVFRQMNIAKLWKLLMVDKVWFFKNNSTLLPDELQIEVNTGIFIIPPVVYAHFLLCLCHYHLNNIIQCQHSLQDLQLTIDEEYFIAGSEERAISYNILGIIFQLVGDIESARRAFIKASE